MMIGLIMVFMQVVIGGVTRLTGSGLSITKWEIVTGSIPPMSGKEWEEAFEL
jgi:cytochrome c oxidase assembly protein subunit 15